MTGGAKPRRDGANTERAMVNWLRTHGHSDARRYLGGDGRQPGDLDAIPGVCIEAKGGAVDRARLKEWLDQAEKEAGERLPVVWVRLRGIPDPGKWAAVLLWKDLYELLGEDRPDGEKAPNV